MAEKHRKLTNDAAVRERIKTAQLVELLENHCFALVDLSQTRVKSIEILLKKTLPDIQVVQVDIEGGININVLQVKAHPPARKVKPAAKPRDNKPAK